MSLEHIFRNLNDIRVFDLFSSCQFDKEHPIEIDEILKNLDYPNREIIQIEASIKHLVDKGILVEIYDEINTSTGCPICARLDGMGFVRPFEHEQHVAEMESIIKIPCYYLDGSSKTGCHLVSAVIASNFRTTEESEKEEKINEIDDLNIKDINDIKNKLKKFEDEYGIQSEDFYKSYKEDKIDKNIDNFNILAWLSYYEIILEKKVS